MRRIAKHVVRLLAVVVMAGAAMTAAPSPAGADAISTRIEEHFGWGGAWAEFQFKNTDYVSGRLTVWTDQCCWWGARANINIYDSGGNWLGWGYCDVIGVRGGVYEQLTCPFQIENWNHGYVEPTYATLDVCTTYNGNGNYWCDDWRSFRWLG